MSHYHLCQAPFKLPQKSGLVKAIFQWSAPGAMVTWKAAFVITLLRRHRIHETLLLVLLLWIPEEIYKTWTCNPTIPVLKVSIYAFPLFVVCWFWNVKGKKPIQNLGIFTILKTHPDMIPHGAHPSLIFFMLSLDNFKLAINQWLRYSLDSLGYNVCFISISSTSN